MQIKRKKHAKLAGIMAIILVAAMILTLLPLATFAAETTGSTGTTEARGTTSDAQAHSTSTTQTTGSTVVSNQATAKVTGTAASTARSGQTSTISMADLIAPALQKATNAAGVAQLLSTALHYNSITEGDIWQLIQQGYSISTNALKLLAQNGTISGYLYKMAAGLPLEPSDMQAVYDKAYYIAHNPAISTAIADGTLASDDQTVFQNFLAVGMPAGLSGSENFDPSYYKTNYPELAAAIGEDNATYYIDYILNGRQKGLIASRLLSR